jgi:hypothetical protein
MPTKHNTNRVAFNIDAELRETFLIYMARKGFTHREQSTAINQLLKAGLKSEGILSAEA